MLVIRLQPNEGMNLMVMIKEPGPGGMRLAQVPLDMSFADALGEEGADIPDAYERLIMDVIRGNQTLFMRGDEVEAAWAWTDPIIRAWEAEGDRPTPLRSGLQRAGGCADADAPRRATLAGDARMKFIEYPDRELMMLSLANRIAGELGGFLRREGRASLCVPGGTTPGPIFDTLSGVDLDWAKVSVFLNDERWVAEDSPRSNTRLLRERLLVGHAAAATLVPLYAVAEAPEEALDLLAQGIAPHLPISVLLLGMGADMHTASLFPGADRLAEALSPMAPPS